MKHFHEYIKAEIKPVAMIRDNIDYYERAEEIRRSPYYRNLERLAV